MTQLSQFELPKKRKDAETLEERMTENAYQRILPARYLNKDSEGNVVETPEQLFERVAENVAQPAKQYDAYSFEETKQEFYDLMTELKFMPNSPTLMNMGDELQMGSACFVLHPEDDMENIFNTARDAALTFKDGGGMGYPFHLLRPKGDIVKSTGGISSGPMSFMEVFDTTCGTIKQGGVRRGAQMGIMRVDHPDILRFIVAKRKEGKFSNFNISVGFTEEFMEAVKNDEEYELINPRTDDVFQTSKKTVEFYSSDSDDYPEAEGSDTGKDDNFWRDFADNFESDVESYRNNLDNLEEGEPFTLPARFIFEAIVDGAWRNGEPGFYNYSEYNDMHSYDVEKHEYKRIEACNPCGEQGLMNGEACNLGHVNLSLLVEEDAPKFEEFVAENYPHYDNTEVTALDLNKAARKYLKEALDMDELERICRTGTRFLDNVVSMNDWPTEDIKETAEKNRKIGLGLMGFAQMLIQMGVRYGSDESIALAKEVQRLITKYAVQESHKLAETKGKFPDWEESKWAEPEEYEGWFNVYAPGVDVEEHSDGYEVRNHNMVTIAPTGTTSMLGDTSGGCEPIFSLAYFKNVAKDIQGEDMLVEFDDYFLKALEHNDVDVEKVKSDAQQKMENNEWQGVQSISDDILPERVKKYFATADQVTPEEHIRIQAAFQKHNHSGISKTCNFPNTATREDVKEAYIKAFDQGVKGMTVYRDGSRDVQVMQENKDNKVIEKIDVKQWLDDADEEDVKDVHRKIEEKVLSKGGEQ
jgi:ribonucleoside-diphosphate reductase alpha chain